MTGRRQLDPMPRRESMDESPESPSANLQQSYVGPHSLKPLFSPQDALPHEKGASVNTSTGNFVG